MSKQTDWFKVLSCLAVAVACVPWTAYVMTVIWGWFVVPLGLHAIGKAQAFGLTLLVGLVRRYGKSDEDSDVSTQIGVSLGAPALILLMGYIAHGFMP